MQPHPPMGTVAAVAKSLIRKDVVHTEASVGPAHMKHASSSRMLVAVLQAWRHNDWVCMHFSLDNEAKPENRVRTVDIVDGGTWRCCQHCGHCCGPHRLTANAHVAQAAQQRLTTARLKQWLTHGRHEAGARNAMLLDQRSHCLHILQLLRRRSDYGAARGDADPEVENVHICKQIEGSACSLAVHSRQLVMLMYDAFVLNMLSSPKLSAIQFSILSPATMPACLSSASLWAITLATPQCCTQMPFGLPVEPEAALITPLCQIHLCLHAAGLKPTNNMPHVITQQLQWVWHTPDVNRRKMALSMLLRGAKLLGLRSENCRHSGSATRMSTGGRLCWMPASAGLTSSIRAPDCCSTSATRAAGSVWSMG